MSSLIKEEIIKVFGNQLRVRVCGICLDHGKLLLVKHYSLSNEGVFWSPPGGGMVFGESAEASLKREFLEETGLEIEVRNFLFVHEYLDPPLHAIELFFEVRATGGELVTGKDPEMAEDKQIIHEVKYFSMPQLHDLPPLTVHNLLRGLPDFNALFRLKGYYKQGEFREKV